MGADAVDHPGPRRARARNALAVATSLQPALLDALAARDHTVLGRMAVDHFTLMRSELTPHGAVYTVLDRFALGLESETAGAP